MFEKHDGAVENKGLALLHLRLNADMEGLMSREIEESLRTGSGVNRDSDKLCGRSAGEKLPRKALRGTKLKEAQWRNYAKMTGVEAVLKMINSSGYVVLQTKPLVRWEMGVTVNNFAGGYLRGLILVVTEKSTRREWNTQIKALGFEDPNGVIRGQKFYRAVLREPK